MKYTKAQKKLFVQWLKNARVAIEDGTQGYVCHAIRRSNVGYTFELTDLINERLDGGTAYGWLYDNHPEVLEEIEMFHSMKTYRLAWIDNMIEEFSK